jgi:hypothetical protein
MHVFLMRFLAFVVQSQVSVWTQNKTTTCVECDGGGIGQWNRVNEASASTVTTVVSCSQNGVGAFDCSNADAGSTAQLLSVTWPQCAVGQTCVANRCQPSGRNNRVCLHDRSVLPQLLLSLRSRPGIRPQSVHDKRATSLMTSMLGVTSYRCADGAAVPPLAIYHNYASLLSDPRAALLFACATVPGTGLVLVYMLRVLGRVVAHLERERRQ